MESAEQLAEVRRQLVDVQSRISRLASEVNDQQWTRRPPAGGWSAAECVVHLTMTNDAYMPLLTAARSAIPAGSAVPTSFRREFGARLLEWFLEPPARAKSKTIAAFVPGAAAPKAQTVADFERSQRALLEFIDTSKGIALDHAKFPSPFNERLKYNPYAALRILAAHERRHLWQAERATRGIP
jgi:hypothetical protein